jgi:Domain of unknown function (DUF4157)
MHRTTSSQRKQPEQDQLVLPTLEPSPNHDSPDGASSGQALDASVRADLEPKFGHSFERIKIHADPHADALSRSVEARAFTVGQDVYFRAGEYAPQAPEGRDLIAHELAHTIQQGAGAAPQNLDWASSHAETEAQHAVAALQFGQTPNLSSRQPALARLKPGESASSVSDADQERTRDIETRMATVSSAAAGRGTELGAISDDCISNLREAKDHLRQSNDNYDAGHKLMTDVLKRADAEYEFDKAVEDSVQGILIAAAITVLGPEVLVGSVVGLEAVKTSTTAGLLAVGLAEAAEGAVAEVAEQGVGGGANKIKSGDGGRPSDSAKQAGDAPGERYKTAFGHLEKMISFLPRVGGVSSSQHNLAHAADRVARAALKTGAGQTAEWPLNTIEEKASKLEQVQAEAVSAMQRASQLRNQVLSIKNQVLAIKIETPTQIENRLWNAWMSSLSGDAHNMLDNDVLEEYLGPNGKGLIDFGSYTSDDDTKQAVSEAQVRWLRDNGIEPGSHPSSQYHGHLHMADLKRRVVGKNGTITGRRTVDIGGTTFTYPGNAGDLEPGTGVIALHITFKQHMNLGDVNIAQWSDNDFDVYCNKLSDMPQTVQPDQ